MAAKPADAKTKTLPSVFSYSDFRRFLAEYQEQRQQLEPDFNRTTVCRRLGLPNSRSFFNDVIKGRPLTQAYVERFVEAFELPTEEAQYFRALVKYNQAQNDKERELFGSQLLSLAKTPRSIIKRRAYEFYSKWYHSVVRTALDIVDFAGDYEALGALIKPPITASQVKASVRLLERLELIAPDARGFLKPTSKNLATGAYVEDSTVKEHQARCIDLCRKAMFEKGGQFRNISTSMMSLSAEALKGIERELQEFKARIRAIINADKAPADRVYQMSLLLFPMSAVAPARQSPLPTTSPSLEAPAAEPAASDAGLHPMPGDPPAVAASSLPPETRSAIAPN